MLKFSKTEFASFYFIFLGILTVEVCFAIDSRDGSYDDCNARGGGICYFVGSHTKQTWYEAHRVCQEKNSSLPIIRSSEEQTAFETYFKTLSSNALRTIWTAGKKQVYNEWTWINGQTLNESHYPNITMISGSAVKTHMQIYMAHSRNELTPEDPFSQSSYLCQYKGLQCSGKFAVNATYGCLIPSGNNVTSSWYEARKSCLLGQGDLAILTDEDIQILSHSIIRNPNFWIGLRKEYWVWETDLGNQASEDVKYTNWAKATNRSDGNLCIFIFANRTKWRASLCANKTHAVVCEKRGKPNDSADNSKTGDNTSIIAAIVAGVVIFILCIFAILVVMWRKSKSSNIKTERAQIDAETMKGSKDENTKEKSSKGNEERCIYADIPLAEKTTNYAFEDGQKGTTYALLDFNEGVTLPIQANCNQPSDVSGPIYAQPFNDIRN